ncbi:hypothetical protein PFLUV_G00234500 [Perca fluviatilis]|uniref:Uncharacterized protein n=1 Tax=Perca fluviatilis TaxID=8168 RepID=A0A6A5E7B0_PERFL|nr:hypothetical protein PFLUV_G00234500 [Perca fluviatilis]
MVYLWSSEGQYDITNLGLSDGEAKEAASSTCRSVVLHTETRKTASGIQWWDLWWDHVNHEELQRLAACRL